LKQQFEHENISVLPG